jgi:ankyrin repeat protein
VSVRGVVALMASMVLAEGGELHQVARTCNADRMRQLLSAKPSVNEMDESGALPLHIAIDARQRACVGLLLAAGADRNARDRKGRSALDAAAPIADARIDYMLKNFFRDGTGGSKQAMPWSLESAVQRGQTELVKMLLAMGADANAAGKDGSTALADASLKGNLEIARLLLDGGAQRDAVGVDGKQPIHEAALGDSADVIRELVSRGANVNTRTKDEGQTPLHLAAAMGKTKAIEALVALGADLTAKDSKGRRPVDAAEKAGLPDIAALLKR